MTDRDAQDILDLLDAIERDEVMLTVVGGVAPQDVYAGSVDYLISNGGRLSIFNDCNEWDYIERVTLPDGRVFHYDSIADHGDEVEDDAEVGDPPRPSVRAYVPLPEVQWRCYGIPGYRRAHEGTWPRMYPPEVIVAQGL